MPLHLYNTLTRQKEEFKPLHEKYVGMYVCGPTVYGHSHLGHGKSYVAFDVIVRYLRYLGYKVTYVQNITDVGHLLGDTNEGEDRLLKASRLEQKHPMEIAEHYTRSYFEDMDALNVLRPDISPRATGHIVEQIEMVKELIAKGFAYEANGSVYFDVHKFHDYGKLSGRTVGELEAGARVEVKSEKRHPADFALWKKADPEHIMRWPSPWAEGFPGWHIECSAMSMKYLGESFDIHGGGLENQFPHHECEIAQSEGATGKPFVKYWLHNNMVTVDGQKMGKSLNNFTTLKDAFKKWKPETIRFFILQSHYRSTLDFSDEAVDAAGKGLDKLGNTVRTVRERMKSATDPGTTAPIDLARHKAAFLAAMDDDFNTPQALAVLFDLSREVNQFLAAEASPSLSSLQHIDALYRELAETILGLTFDDTRGDSSDALILDGLMGLILDLRKDIRAQKMYALSDKIRDTLKAMGIVVEDKKDGTTTWRKGQ
ncbi:cysteine--tRNA ligase [Sphingobacteriales bacterium CHB3]|nr:cysteine--tRNA ligase [Sphingobacteriales bacterium CHB3]